MIQLEESFVRTVMLEPVARKPARQNLAAALAACGSEIRGKYGSAISGDQLLKLLEDRSVARYPCSLRFDDGPLLPGEFAHTLPNGATPQDGYTIFIHPRFADQSRELAYLVLHQLVLVNYGPSATADDAEIFGATVLGLTQREYYQALCALADQMGGDELM